jgi:hypothetical protein
MHDHLFESSIPEVSKDQLSSERMIEVDSHYSRTYLKKQEAKGME